ncbi:MAG: ABC transporter ATP-binding protein [Bacteroidetes bacterium]|nr:MAG: ABC transporter ATP-binding protein [Bacteroidota bacterium]
MLNAVLAKFKRLRTNLHIKRTIGLVWTVAPRWTAIVLIMVILESGLFFSSLYFLKLLINAVAKHANDSLVRYILSAGISSILYAIAKSIATFAAEVQAGRVSEYIDDRIHQRAIELDLSFYESPSYFDTLKRAKEAGSDRPNAIVINLTDTVKSSMMLLALGSVLLSIDWFLLPLLVLFVIPTMLVRISFSEKLYKWRMNHTSLERKSLYLSDLITSDTSAKEVRSLGIGKYFRSLYLNIRIKLLTQRLNILRKSTGNEILTTILATSAFFVCVAYIALSVSSGRVTVGDITLFLVIFPQSFVQMQALSACISNLYQNNIFVTNLFDLFDLKPVITDKENAVPVPVGNINLSVRNLNFTYPHTDKQVLRDINMKFPAGKIISIVGLNGAGKTTLIKLLSRLYDPTSGSIALNDIDIRHFNPSEYRKQISIVFQDFGRYNFSAADNIRFGNIDGSYDESAIMEAAQRSGANDYIKTFPERYQTIMGRLFEDGHEVSMGQWQKLAIARALYSPAKLIIFDEATSALDALAERQFFQSFRERIDDRAAVIISHRISAVAHADYIYVLSNGEIKQSGTHEQLLSMRGDYALLFGKESSKLNPA